MKNLSKQYTGMQKQQFFGHWRWVHIRICQNCKNTVRILGNDTRMRPDLPPGAISCPHCNALVSLG